MYTTYDHNFKYSKIKFMLNVPYNILLPINDIGELNLI